MRHRTLCSILLAVPCLLLAMQPAFARESFLKHMRRLYALDRSLGKCALCHTTTKPDEEPDKTNLNDFGHDIANDPRIKPLLEIDEDETPLTAAQIMVLGAVLKDIGRDDSDRDGALNAEELALGTWPHDPKSTPSADALAKLRAAPAK
jgi:hypothetical protein